MLLNLPAHFPLEKYGYTLERILNNKNRWHTKIVRSILTKDFNRYVATTYKRQSDYLKLIENTQLLMRNNKLAPQIVNLYPEYNSVICKHIGDFFSERLLANTSYISSVLTSVLDYLKGINSINQSYKTFIVPSIIESSLQVSEEFNDVFEFLPKSKMIFPELQKAGIKFAYGYGIEDPHIWNFRIMENNDKSLTFTTDFDFFIKDVNYFWELGYFYATFRWLKKTALSISRKAEGITHSLIKDLDLKTEFMFWLGALSSYCGYKESLKKLMLGAEIIDLQKQHQLIQQLDEKVADLANRLLLDKVLLRKN